MIYVDTSVLISYINPEDTLHDKASKYIEKYRTYKLVVSDLTVIELYSVYSRTIDVSDVELNALVRYTLRKIGVEKQVVDWNRVFREAGKYANKLKLKTLDLLHLTIAVTIGCRIFLTFDKDIVNRKEQVYDVLSVEVVG
ncbi:MAG: PIN domain-containing protein [Thermoprotei archaeon]